MAEDDLTLRMRAVGARRAAREVDTASKSVGGLGKSVDKTSRSAKKGRASVGLFGGTLGKIKSYAGPAAAALGIAGIGGAIRTMTTEFRDQHKVGRQTAAVIKSTGGVANVTQSQLEGLSTSLSNQLGIEDDLIQKSGNMLLTFKNVRNEQGKGNDIFNQATKTLLDMSAATKGHGVDSANAAIKLGKALNDPVKGISALSRVGVTFTEGQKKQIEGLVESGNTMQAQKMILRELNSEFGGSAKAQTDPIDQARTAWLNLMQLLGGYVYPLITKGANIFGTFVTGIQSGTGAGGKFRDIVLGIVEVLKSLWKWVGENRQMMLQLGAAVLIAVAAWKAFMIINTVIRAVTIAIALLKALRTGQLAATAAQYGLNTAILANPIGLAVIALTALVAGLIVAYHKIGWFRDGVNWLWGAMKNVFGWIKKNWPLLATILGGPIGAAVALIITHWDGVKGAISSGVDWIIGRVNDIIGAMNTAIGAFNKLPGPDIGEIPTIGQIGAAGATGYNAAATQAATGHMARGGLVRQPGVYEVGERGRERVALPAGAQVAPNGGGFGDVVVHSTLVMPNGDVLAKNITRSSLRKKAAR